MIRRTRYVIAACLVLSLWYVVRPGGSAKASPSPTPVNVVLASGTITARAGQIAFTPSFDISLSHDLGIYAECTATCSGISASLAAAAPAGFALATVSNVVLPDVSYGGAFFQFAEVSGPRGGSSAQLRFDNSSATDANVDWIVLSRSS